MPIQSSLLPRPEASASLSTPGPARLAACRGRSQEAQALRSALRTKERNTQITLSANAVRQGDLSQRSLVVLVVGLALAVTSMVAIAVLFR